MNLVRGQTYDVGNVLLNDYDKEEFVESFASPSDDPEDNETTFRHANILVDCGGLNVSRHIFTNRGLFGL